MSDTESRGKTEGGLFKKKALYLFLKYDPKGGKTWKKEDKGSEWKRQRWGLHIVFEGKTLRSMEKRRRPKLSEGWERNVKSAEQRP